MSILTVFEGHYRKNKKKEEKKRQQHQQVEN